MSHIAGSVEKRKPACGHTSGSAMRPHLTNVSASDLPAAAFTAVVASIVVLCTVHALASSRGRASLVMWLLASVTWTLAVVATIHPAWFAPAGRALLAAPALAAMCNWCAMRRLIPTVHEDSLSFGSNALPLLLIAVAGLAPAAVGASNDPLPNLPSASVAVAVCLGAVAVKTSEVRIRIWIVAKFIVLAGGGVWVYWAGRSAVGPAPTAALGYAWVMTLTGLFFGIHQANEHRMLIKRAGKDELTGLNRRQALIDHVRSLGLAPGSRVAVIMIDADHFKRINDSYGHPAGDAVLAQLGRLVRESVRDVDLAARYGGEEFCVVLPETEVEGARTVAERLVESVRRTTITLDDGATLRITVSAGFAVGLAAELEQCFRWADSALYRAKAQGRDRVTGPLTGAGSLDRPRASA